VYNIGGSRALANRDVILKILDALGKPESLMQRVQDRPGHDRRYALDSSKLRNELGWQPQVSVDEGLNRTIEYFRKELDRQ
jgi:dTDP-glucose 4,6-dehydratase